MRRSPSTNQKRNSVGMRRQYTSPLAAAGLVAALAAATMVIARDNVTPDEWLQRMSNAIQTLDYEGTVLRRQGSKVKPLKIVHKKIDGVVNERIVLQEGSGLELIRIGDEVHCILHEKKKVLIETWDTTSALFSTLPSSKIEPGAQYDVLILSVDERVAGHKAVKLAIRPTDSDRYEHRYWLDRETGFPLQAEMVNLDGVVIEETRFADIRINSNIAANSLAPSISLDNFTWYTSPGSKKHETVETSWVSDDLPRGFNTLSVSQENLQGSSAPVTHIVYGDGLARVSVFISEAGDGELSKSEVRGSSHAYSTDVDGHRITAVGEVPASTVKAIASSMRRP